jgi:outer membrane protein assembly factor BamA
LPRNSLHRARIALIGLSFLLATFGVAAAQQAYNVVDIETVGNRVTSSSLILGVASIDKGSPLTPTVIQNALHRLYGLGIFSDVKLEAETVTGGVKVYVIVRELPKLIGLEFSGNKKIKSKKLKEELGLGVGGYISPLDIFRRKSPPLWNTTLTLPKRFSTTKSTRSQRSK